MGPHSMTPFLPEALPNTITHWGLGINQGMWAGVGTDTRLSHSHARSFAARGCCGPCTVQDLGLSSLLLPGTTSPRERPQQPGTSQPL